MTKIKTRKIIGTSKPEILNNMPRAAKIPEYIIREDLLFFQYFHINKIERV